MAFYVLLPLDRGFPTIPVFGRPLNSAIAATLVVFFVTAVQSRGAVLSHLREPYSLVQSAYCCVLVASALRAASPPSALHASLLYFCTFVLNYAVLRYLTRIDGVRWFSTFVVKVGIAGAAIGIAQSVMGIPTPLYDAWFKNYFATPAENYMLATVRAAGTMNNPILYCVLMALVIPYTLDLKHMSSRALAVFTVLFAAGLSGSRTVLVVAAFAGGAVAVYRRRMLLALPAIGLGLALLVASLGGPTAATQDARVAFLLERAGFKAESQADVSAAAFGISLRREVLAEGFREMSQEWGGLTWIVGRGYFTAASVGEKVLPWYNTVDNVYLTVLYERGLAGLVLFVGAFITFLIRTRRAATITLHWYAPLALALAGLSFSWDGYSTFNILAVGSMAVAMWHEERARWRLARARSARTNFHAAQTESAKERLTRPRSGRGRNTEE